MDFEYNQNKSDANREKHGIRFEEAKQLWAGSYVEIQAKTVDEPRFLLIGQMKEKYYSCIFTKRGEIIRIISCRRSREREEAIYHEYIGKKE